jgi:hypothetical protein
MPHVSELDMEVAAEVRNRGQDSILRALRFGPMPSVYICLVFYVSIRKPAACLKETIQFVVIRRVIHRCHFRVVHSVCKSGVAGARMRPSGTLVQVRRFPALGAGSGQNDLFGLNLASGFKLVRSVVLPN